MTHPPVVFLSALEASADLHAAGLIRAIRAARPDARFVGVAGPNMRDAGCETVHDVTARSAMLLGAVGLAGEAGRLLCRLDRLFASGAVDVVVPVDSPTFNLPLARRAKARGLPVAYYIAPQVWAWAEFRVRKIRRRTDRLAVILPFEEAYFRGHGIDATYVGHPLIESLERQPVDRAAVDRLRALGTPVIACLPGSRRHVVDEVLPGQLDVCRQIAAAHPTAAFLFAAASDAVAARIRTALTPSPLQGEGSVARALAGPPARTGGSVSSSVGWPTASAVGDPNPSARYVVAIGQNADLIAAADLVLVASGTATLEVAWHRRPMIVMYNASRWGYQLIARRLIRTKHLSLVNILAGRELVPEFMPYYRSTEPIARAALDLLTDRTRRDTMIAGLEDLVRSLGSHRAANETARLVLETCDAHSRPIRRPRGSRHQIW